MQDSNRTDGCTDHELKALRSRISELETESARHDRELDELRKYRQLFSEVNDLAYMCDDQGNILYINKVFEKLTNQNPRFYIGKSFAPLFDEENLLKAMAMYTATLKGETSQDEITFKDTGVICEYKNYPLRDSEGNIKGILGIARDITKRKKAERELQKIRENLEHMVEERTSELETSVDLLRSEINDRIKVQKQLIKQREYVHNIIESVSHPLLVIDVRDYRVVHMNSAARHNGAPENVTCYKLSHGLDSPCDGIEHKCAIKEILKTKKPVTLEHVHLVNGNSSRIVEIHGYPIFNANREVVQVIEYNLDVTERKKTEEALIESKEMWRSLTATSPDHIVTLGTDLNIQLVNFASPGLTVEELIGTPLYKYVSEDRQDEIRAVHERVLRTHEIESYETSYRTPFGQTIYYESRVVPRIVDGKIIGLTVAARDITERKQVEVELARHRDHLNDLVLERTYELKRSNEQLQLEIAERKRAEAEAMRASHLAALGELAAGVAHEINNPINGVINYAQIILNRSGHESKDRDIAKQIIRESDRIAEIVNNLLFFARDMQEKKYPVNLHEIIYHTLILNRTQLRRDGIELNLELPERLPDVSVHAQQIEQVFLNIISNARYALNQKYAQGGEKRVTIRSQEMTVDGSRYIQLAFHDNGPGIPEEIIDRIMNPFFSTKPAKHGTGLGLSISHGIIDDHGGEMTVESREGEFTTVYVSLPVKESDEESQTKEYDDV